MDSIKFEVYEDENVLNHEGKFARTVINGRPVVEYVKECERLIADRGELDEELIGDYKDQFADILYRYLAIKDYRLFNNSTIGLMICGGCLEEGCWPLFVTMSETPDVVTWYNFYNPYVCGEKCYGSLETGKPYKIAPISFCKS